MNLASS